MNPSCPMCGAEDGFRIENRYRTSVVCRNPECMFEIEPATDHLIVAAIATYNRDHAPRIARQNAALDARVDALKAANVETLPNSCPDCGAGILIGTKIAVCEANKYASRSGAGDCRWTLDLTPDLRRQADEALAAQGGAR